MAHHQMRYYPSCNQAHEYIKVLTDDPMSEGAPIDEIVQEWLKRHAKNCQFCMEATVDGNTP